MAIWLTLFSLSVRFRDLSYACEGCSAEMWLPYAHPFTHRRTPYPANLRLHIYIVAEVNDQHIVSISILLRPLLLLRSRSVVDLLSEGLHRIIFTSFGASIFHKRDQSEMVAFLAEPDVPWCPFRRSCISTPSFYPDFTPKKAQIPFYHI